MAIFQTASEILVQTIHEWGVDVVFGLPGDGINGLIEAFRKHQDKIRFIQVRHEESAAFMACAYAKYTGKLGCCIATSGPGGIHLLNGLYDAKMDAQPVLAITGLQYSDLVGTHTQQDVALDRVFQDVAVYSERVMNAAHIENVTDLACRAALTQRGVAHVTVPVDVQTVAASKMKKEHSRRNLLHHTSHRYAHPLVVPDAEALHQAAQILNSGKKVAILAGRGAIHATDELLAIAERLGAPIVKALLGKAAVPDDSPYCMGGIGLLGTKPGQELMETCDTLLMVGTSFPYIEFLPKPGQAKCVQIDLEGWRIGLRYDADVGLVGDSRICLKALLPLIKEKTRRSYLEDFQNEKREWDELMKERGTRMDKPMKPQVVAWELGKRLKDNAIISCDTGTITTWWARQIYARRGQMFMCSGTLATMAPGLPYTIAAQLAFPDRQCVGFVGDGGFSMLMADFVTAVKYKLPIKIVVVKNNVLGQIKWEQMVLLGNPEYVVELEPMDFAGIARNMGGPGYRIEDPAECGDVLDEALSNDKPALIEAIVDPNEPPLPGKIKPEQALHFAESLMRGQPASRKIVETIIGDKYREVI